ncbi:helix-turn-helix domain-containing protein [Streptomyces sp. NPDC001073]
MEDEIWMTAREAADHFGVHIRTVQSWTRRGHLTATGLSPFGKPMYRYLDVAKAELKTRRARPELNGQRVYLAAA